MTSDTQLANWMADPVNAVPRVYVATVRGRVTAEGIQSLQRGIR
jgi:16S rRNA U516 pseudouridylate synthase RsuA-like enzyme